MSIKTILVHAQGDGAAAPRLETAAHLARDLGATLYGLGAEMIQPLSVADPYGVMEAQWIVAMRDLVETNLQAAEKAFMAASDGLTREWRAVTDLPAHAMARASRSADLILAGGAPLGHKDVYRACETGELVITAGRPVLVAPPEGGRLKADKVVVAWKDVREARRALADAMPFLIAAKEVVIAALVGEDGLDAARFQTDEVIKGLSRHGVTATARVGVAPEAAVADELNAIAAEVGADLIVCGGYGHSRLNEWVFGGVTRDLLLNPGRFVLLSH
jgi:nucleotide-binding universal stress UspA family protein